MFYFYERNVCYSRRYREGELTGPLFRLSDRKHLVFRRQGLQLRLDSQPGVLLRLRRRFARANLLELGRSSARHGDVRA
jgi:hypothetical protein